MTLLYQKIRIPGPQQANINISGSYLRKTNS